MNEVTYLTDNDQLQQHLESSLHGTPQTNPDERRRYLGSLRERVFLSMTNAQLQQPALQKQFEAHLNEFKPYQVLLNGKNEAATQYLAALSAQAIPFTLVNNETAQLEPTAYGLLVVAAEAINCDPIAIDLKYPVPHADQPVKNPKKPSLFKRLFD